MTQPEALRLADDLTKYLGGNTASQAAAELRRLSAVEAQRDALLEALKEVVAYTKKPGAWDRARAAIKKAEEHT